MGMKLFDGSDVSDEEEISKIEINKEFARRYEHNKKREDMQKFEELKKNGVISDSSDAGESSSDEAEKDELTDSKRHLEFLNALIKVKNHDPELRSKEAKLFESESEEDEIEGEGEKRDKKEKKSMYLKDVTARYLIEEGPEFEEEEEEGERVKSYSEEQEELRREFLNAAEAALDADDGEELLKERDTKGMGDEVVDVDDDDAGEVEKKLDEFFGEDGKLDNNEKFLKEYFRNRMWVGDEGNKGVKALAEEKVLDLSEDEEEVEKQEDYERGYNFRHEENAGDRVLGHSRVVEGSVRKKTNARKAQRKSKEERMAQAEFEKKEELKHMKNLKKKEIKEKLRRIKDTAGIVGNRLCPLDLYDLEEEFDPEEYDRKMKEAFNDDYYGAEDVDPGFGSDGDEDELGKPDFGKEDEFLGITKGWDDVSGSGDGDGFLAFRERKLKRRAENGGSSEQIDEEVVNEEGKQKKKRKMSEMEEEVIKKELEEYYKLDYEDTIGDLKTRFKYRDVGAKKFGLSTEEILVLDDKELNQFVSLKKIAPYREKEWNVPRNMRYDQKQRKKQLLQGASDDQKIGNKFKLEYKKSKEVAVSTEHEEQDMSNLSRKSKRKHRQAELKLSHSRLMAYGKIPSKSKSKKKH